ncbi:winged helix-turn-helix transcriptional regulator [Streptomyces sp. NPDC060311]|uniref:winged helix-turn-helix transcriptional regulator n=1 Tax=Streptomyces sp. NPDC060311 TaxID=3347096 RepID=UPI0036574EA3
MRVHGPERRGPLPRVRDGGCGPAGGRRGAGVAEGLCLTRQGAARPGSPASLSRSSEDGLITRSAYAEVPPRVEYALALLGCRLHEIVMQLIRWAADHHGEIRIHRSRVGTGAASPR